ncbi:hypothetical protein D3C86_406760 [compost metagenome]|jgi:hypothetical protein
MEKNHESSELPQDKLKRRERKFGNKVVKNIVAGDEWAILNPRLKGLGGYRNEDIYPYIQGQLQEQGIASVIEETPMESGSEAPIPRHRLIVTSRHTPETDQ